jgi:uncharacterized protein (TIGR02246 family)
MKFKNFSLIFVFVFCFVLLCCVPPAKEEMDVEKVRVAIEEGSLKVGEVVRQGDAAALAALYTDDATLLPPDSEMIQGKQGIEAFWSQGIKMGIKDLVLTTLDVFGSGDLAYEIGKFTLTVQPEGQEPVEQKGKYVVVWKQAADGSWKLHVDIFNYIIPTQK